MSRGECCERHFQRILAAVRIGLIDQEVGYQQGTDHPQHAVILENLLGCAAEAAQYHGQFIKGYAGQLCALQRQLWSTPTGQKEVNWLWASYPAGLPRDLEGAQGSRAVPKDCVWRADVLGNFLCQAAGDSLDCTHRLFPAALLTPGRLSRAYAYVARNTGAPGPVCGGSSPGVGKAQQADTSAWAGPEREPRASDKLFRHISLSHLLPAR